MALERQNCTLLTTASPRFPEALRNTWCVHLMLSTANNGKKTADPHLCMQTHVWLQSVLHDAHHTRMLCSLHALTMHS